MKNDKKKKLNGIKANVRRSKNHFLGEITFHINHYEEVADIFDNILKQLRREGWKLDVKRNKNEEIGIYTFRHRWVKRKFYK